MFKKLFNTKRKKEIALKKHTFFQFAKSIGAIDNQNLNDISIDQLLLLSYEFLNQERVVSVKKEKELLIFKDRYNRYVEYCISENLVKKTEYPSIEELDLIKVPDMSHIEVTDISKELKEMNIDMEEIGSLLANFKYK